VRYCGIPGGIDLLKQNPTNQPNQPTQPTTPSFDLLSEMTHPSARGKQMLGQQYYWTAGGLLTSFFYVIVKGWWRGLVFLSCLPAMTAGVLFAIYGTESLEWLESQGRTEDRLREEAWIANFEGVEWEEDAVKEKVVVQERGRNEGEGGKNANHTLITCGFSRCLSH
jgi:hypothetical protein